MTAEQFAEVVGSPYASWLAPVGTAAPAIDADETTFDPAWVLMGTNGINNQGTGGVTISLGRTMSNFTPAGLTLPVKSWVTDEALTVGGSLVDMTVEQLAMIMDDAAVTSVTAATGHAGEKSVNLLRGVNVAYFSLLVRGISPYDDGTGLNCQYEFSRVFQSATQAPAYVKGTPAELAWEYTVAGTIVGSDAAIYRAADAARS